MKDIDFDELDRAVSSLMGAVPARADNEPKTSESATEAAQNEPASDSASPVVSNDTPSVVDAPEPSVEAATETAPKPDIFKRPASSPAIRRGRFMDVVRPTAQPAKSSPLSSRPVSRQAPTLQPVNSTDATQSTPSSFDLKEPESNVSEPDFAGEQFDAEQFTTEITAIEAVEEFSNTQLAEEVQRDPLEEGDDSPPLSSPFLPDAKVEKRPLGRPVEPAPPAALASEFEDVGPGSDQESAIIPDSSSDKDAQLPEQPLPPELGHELLSIETGTDQASPEAPHDPVAPPAEQMVVPPVSSDATSSPAVSRPAVASIPQQYKVKPPKPGNDEPVVGSLYDAQPLTHPAEGKPGWVWVVAIIGIILLGIGFGVAFYYLGLS